MYCDFVLMKIDSDVESFANKLGFSKLYFLSDFDKLGLFESKDYDTNRKLVESKKIKILVNPHLNNYIILENGPAAKTESCCLCGLFLRAFSSGSTKAAGIIGINIPKKANPEDFTLRL